MNNFPDSYCYETLCNPYQGQIGPHMQRFIFPWVQYRSTGGHFHLGRKGHDSVRTHSGKFNGYHPAA